MIDKKKAVTNILIALKAKKPKEEEMDEEMDEEESDVSGLEVAAEEIMAAIEKKDVQLLTQALKSFVEMCD